MSLRAWSTPGFVIVAQRYWDMGQEMREPIKMLHLKPWSQRWRTADSFSHTSAMFTELGWTISSMRNYREFCMQVSWWVKEIVMMPILRCTPTSSLMDWLSRKKDWHFKKNAVIFFFHLQTKFPLFQSVLIVSRFRATLAENAEQTFCRTFCPFCLAFVMSRVPREDFMSKAYLQRDWNCSRCS